MKPNGLFSFPSAPVVKISCPEHLRRVCFGGDEVCGLHTVPTRVGPQPRLPKESEKETLCHVFQWVGQTKTQNIYIYLYNIHRITCVAGINMIWLVFYCPIINLYTNICRFESLFDMKTMSIYPPQKVTQTLNLHCLSWYITWHKFWSSLRLQYNAKLWKLLFVPQYYTD